LARDVQHLRALRLWRTAPDAAEAETVVLSRIGRVLVRLGHALERACFGQSQSNYATSQVANAQVVATSHQANHALAEVRRQLSGEFGIDLRWPILLELKPPPARGWKATFYNPEGNVARHCVIDLKGNPAHQVLVRPNLERTRFKAVLAHELTHAFQREANFLNQNLGLREGMARWIEYHFLQGSAEAIRLLKVKHYTFGRAVRDIVDHENRQGRPATIRWLREQA
jgi:hypothetical protein